jgi:hypothetical protein
MSGIAGLSLLGVTRQPYGHHDPRDHPPDT